MENEIDKIMKARQVEAEKNKAHILSLQNEAMRRQAYWTRIGELEAERDFKRQASATETQYLNGAKPG